MERLSKRPRPDSAGRGNPPHDPSSPPTATKKNTAIFITGLPDDTTVPELEEAFVKYGVIMDDLFTGKRRIKLYEDDNGVFKGEALIVYLREESAKLAVDLMDESQFRLDAPIHVEMAKFEDSTPSEATAGAVVGTEEKSGKKPAVDKKVWKQHMREMHKKLEWTANDKLSPEEEAQLHAELRRREKHARIVVLRGMFTASQVAHDAGLVMELKEDLLAETERLGDVTAVRVLPDLQLCTVKFAEKESAAACVRIFNGRYYDGRRIAAFLYDGSFSLREGRKGEGEEEEQTAERLEKFAEWLENPKDHGE